MAVALHFEYVGWWGLLVEGEMGEASRDQPGRPCGPQFGACPRRDAEVLGVDTKNRSGEFWLQHGRWTQKGETAGREAGREWVQPRWER